MLTMKIMVAREMSMNNFKRNGTQRKCDGAKELCKHFPFAPPSVLSFFHCINEDRLTNKLFRKN